MPISVPTQIAVPFATSGLKNAIPSAANPITGNAGYDQGFTATNMTPLTAGGIAPFGQDFNGIFFDITTAIQFLEAGGSFPYNSTFSTAVGGYPLGAIVSRTDGTGLWRNVVANNTTNPEAGGAGWQPEDAGSTAVTMTNANVTLTSLQGAKSILLITGALTASVQLIIPVYIKQWLIVNNCTGAFAITAKTASGSGVVIPTGLNQLVYCDGTNIIASSSNLSQMAAVVGGVRNGAMSIQTTSATATFTADEVAVKSALGGIPWLLPSFNKTINLAATGAGGMDTGTAPVSGFVAIYAIYNSTTGASALLAVNATSTKAPEVYGGANMPAGYTASALVSVWPTASSLLKIGAQIDRRIDIASMSVLASGTAVTSNTALGVSTAIPLNAKIARVAWGVSQGTAGSGVSLVVSSTLVSVGAIGAAATATSGTSQVNIFGDIQIIVAQTIYYTNASTNAVTNSISICGYAF